jgi:hypothetical protein
MAFKKKMISGYDNTNTCAVSIHSTLLIADNTPLSSTADNLVSISEQKERTRRALQAWITRYIKDLVGLDKTCIELLSSFKHTTITRVMYACIRMVREALKHSSFFDQFEQLADILECISYYNSENTAEQILRLVKEKSYIFYLYDGSLISNYVIAIMNKIDYEMISGRQIKINLFCKIMRISLIAILLYAVESILRDTDKFSFFGANTEALSADTVKIIYDKMVKTHHEMQEAMLKVVKIQKKLEATKKKLQELEL